MADDIESDGVRFVLTESDDDEMLYNDALASSAVTVVASCRVIARSKPETTLKQFQSCFRALFQ